MYPMKVSLKMKRMKMSPMMRMKIPIFSKMGVKEM
jgi:hypothetical protein